MGDRRCLITILEQYVTPAVMQQNFQFSESGHYRFPVNTTGGTLSEFREVVDNFPITEMPEVFGMHDNANMSFMQQESDALLNVVLAIQPREASSEGGKSPDQIVSDIAAEETERLPSILIIEGAHASTFAKAAGSDLVNPMGTCLGQEVGRFNNLLKTLQGTLVDIQRAIKGLIVMTEDLDNMFQAMLNNHVPPSWADQNVSYPSLKPLSSWFEDMIQRVEFMRDWVMNGTPNVFWISGFYFPQGFLTSVLQGYSRSNMIPVDKLGFEFQPEDIDEPQEVEAPSVEGIYIYGIFMDGCAWDYEEQAITDQEVGVMYMPAPIITFIPQQDKVVDADKCICPLYKTSVRAGTLSTTGLSTNFILAIDLDSLEKQSHWILRGAALLSMLND